ncbi:MULTISPECIES: hypothetical protein [unclassified Rathayibacter]|uniref:hypothetical protein n=1 Tax=unclassified Rathayibacter TaxID=2609250 RepID=UPI0006FA66D1|nr:MULTISPECIES: hypothetical protein [unclassified Rathayibacter]KQQ05600.1 hypothetical protein ASF42_03270 [Rathayibacter sp. Leaf294]KQS13461.1 hypothetical protein ASG06_03280 [Rathayibacter sp. Leaf185]
MAKKLWISLGALLAIGLGGAAIVVFVWMIDETHFDRPDEGFDRLTAQVESLPGASVDGSERWVEAPTFSDPTSWIGLSVDEAGLAEVIDTSCASPYPSEVMWTLRVRTDGGNSVTVNSPAEGAAASGPCLDSGLDAAALAERIGGAAQDLELYASNAPDGPFALVALEEGSVLDDDAARISALLPLVTHAEALRDAAGVDSTVSVDIGGSLLSVLVEPGESERYRALLDRLVDEHGVTRYYADGGNQIDGVAKVQIVAPDDQHAAIEAAVRDSGLHIADLPVRFLEP